MQSLVNVKRAQVSLVFVVIGITVGVNLLILLSPTQDAKNFFGNTIRPSIAGVAMVLAILVVVRQKFSGKFGKAYAGIAFGMVLYFCAEVTWAYYSVGLGITVPFPSLADGFWLSAYAPFGYGIF